MTNTQTPTAHLYLSALCHDPELEFHLEPGLDWYSSPDGLVRFAWEDEEALSFVLVRWTNSNSKVLKHKLTASNMDLATFRAVARAFVHPSL